ncbi:hypothetical protein N3K61_20645, partial [Escherichia coli]|uniref:hypothetical protein n=1 Tax=Escherichia coli TaxID=562 RepID=UPI0021BE2EB1
GRSRIIQGPHRGQRQMGIRDRDKEQAKKSAGWDRAKSMTFFVCSNFYENVAILKRPQARRRNVI